MFQLNHRRRRAIGRIALAAALSATFVACGSDDDSSDGGPSGGGGGGESSEVRMILYAASLFDWCYYASVDQGFFEDESVAIADDPLIVSTDADINRAMIAGEGDISLGTIGLFQTYEEGSEPAVSFIGGTGMAPYSFVGAGASEGDIDSLSGGTIALPPEGQPSGIVAQAVLDERLGEGSYDPLQAGGGSGARVAAVESGQADGAFMAAPFDQVVVEQADDLAIIDYLDAESTEFQIGVLLARRAWVDEDPDLAARWMRAYTAGCDWVYDEANRDDAIRILAEVTESSETAIAGSYDTYITGDLAGTSPIQDASIDRDALENVVDELKRAGTVDEGFESAEIVDAFVDDSVLDQAAGS